MAIEVKLAATPEAWELDSPADLLAAVTELAERGWRGEIDFWHEAVDGVPSGPLQWSLSLNAESGGGGEVTASLGDRLLLAGGVLQCLTPEEWAGVTA